MPSRLDGSCVSHSIRGSPTTAKSAKKTAKKPEAPAPAPTPVAAPETPKKKMKAPEPQVRFTVESYFKK
jgi:hypothetical protein